MSDSDGHVVITTEIDTSQYEQSLREIRTNTQSMNNSLISMSQRASRDLQSAVRQMGSSLSNISQDATDAVTSSADQINKTFTQLSQNANQQVSTVTQRMTQLVNTFSSVTTSQIAKNAKELANALSALNRTAAGEITTNTYELTNSLSRVSREVGSEIEDSSSKIIGSIDEMSHVASRQLKETTYNMATAINEISGQVSENISNQAAEVETAVTSMGDNVLDTLESIGAAMGLAVGVHEFSHMAGLMTDLESRARIAAKGMSDVSAIMIRLRDIADKAYSPLEATASSFMNNSFSLNDLGMRMEKQLDLTDALTNALVVSGAKGEMFELVMNAVNRSLATGKMNGEELEMVLKYGGAAADAIAKKLGTTIYGLKELAKQGELTSDVIADSLIGSLDELREKSEAMPATIGDALVRLRNQLMATTGEINTNIGFSDNVVKGIDAIKNNMNSLVKELPIIAAGMTAFMATRSNFGRSIQNNMSARVMNIKAIQDENRLLGAQNALLPAVKQNLTGISSSLSNQLPLHKALVAAIKGDSAAYIDLARSELSTSSAAANLSRNNLRLATTHFNAAKAAHAHAVATGGGATTITALTSATNALLLAEQKLTTDITAETAARNQLNAVLSRSNVGTVQQIELDIRAAIAKKTSQLATLANAQATAFATNNLQRHYLLSRTINRITAERIALTNQLTIATARTAAAQSAATAGAMALRGVLAAGKGIVGLFGGPWGLAMIAATVGLTKLMTMESEAERISRSYAQAIEEVVIQHNLLGESAEAASAAMSVTSETVLNAKLESIKDDLKTTTENLLQIMKLKLKIDNIESLKPDYFAIYGPTSENRAKIKSEVMRESQEFKDDLYKILKLIQEFKSGAITELQDFETKYRDKIKGMKQFSKMMTEIFNPGDIKNAPVVVYEALINQMNDVKDKLTQIEREREQDSLNSLNALLNKQIGLIESSMSTLKELGIEFSSIELFDLSEQTTKLKSSTDQIAKYFDSLLSKINIYKRDIATKISDEKITEENIKALIERDKQLSALSIQLNKAKTDAILYNESKLYSELRIKEEERQRKTKLNANETLEIQTSVVKKLLDLKMAEAKAELQTNIEKARENVKIQQMLMDVFVTTSQKSMELGVVQAGVISRNFGVALAQMAIAEQAMKDMMANFDETVRGILTKLGIGAQSASKGMGAAVNDQAKALREVELSLAKIENRKVKVIELEQIQELGTFNELVTKAGLKGKEAAEYLERFKIAQKNNVNTENLQEQLNFYEKLRGLLPVAGAEYEKIREQLIKLELEQYNAIGIQKEYLQVYSEQQRLRESTSAIDGLRVAVQDYTSNLTPAKAAQSMFNDIMNGTRDALVAGIFHANSFGEAMRNLGNIVVTSLQRIIVEMVIMKPIMMAFNSLLGGGLGSFFGSMFGGGGGTSGGGGSSGWTTKALHQGGVVGSSGKNITVNPFVFANAQKMHSGGVAGIKINEVPIIAKAGEMILTQSDQRSLLNFIRSVKEKGGSSNGGQLNVQIINQTTKPVEAQTSANQNSNGGFDLQVLIREIDSGLAQRQSAGASKFDKNIRATYQLNNAQSIYRKG
jgi:tape measure domain-containing protein